MKINVTGDFAPIFRVEKLIDNEDYKHLFNDVMPQIKQADLSITNLELPLTTHDHFIEKTGQSLRGLPKSVKALKAGGFSLVTLANNHILDYGEQGLKDTIKALERDSIAYVGAGANNDEARKPYFFEKGGKILAVLSIAENEWSTTFGENWGANPLNEIDNYYDIVSAKKKADFVLVIVHAGHEHYPLPAPRVKKLFRFFVDAGADAVVGHHTHAYSGYEIYNDRPIVYSLGNFIFDWNSKIPYWNEGIIAQIDFADSNIKLEIIPFIQNDVQIGVRLMNEKQKEIFEDKIKDINLIIANDEKLTKSFDVFLQKRHDLYISYIQPYTSKNILRLRNIGLFPRDILSHKKKKLLINIIRCETHREALLDTLKTSLKK